MTTLTCNTTLLGLDLGSQTVCVRAHRNGGEATLPRNRFSAVVGRPEPGVLPGVLPPGPLLFGDAARDFADHLDVVRPFPPRSDADRGLATEFFRFLRESVGVADCDDVRAVMGLPMEGTPQEQERLRAACAGVFEHAVFFPEALLIAAGCRDAVRRNGVDPMRCSLVIDVGAATTRCTLVRGREPKPEEHVTVNVAGDGIDQELQRALARRFPELELSVDAVRGIKERHAYVGAHRSVPVRAYVGGHPVTVDLGDVLRNACESVVEPILDGVTDVLSCCDSEVAASAVRCIIVAGGGAGVANLGESLQEELRRRGHEDAVVHTPTDPQDLIARGAVSVAIHLDDAQWLATPATPVT